MGVNVKTTTYIVYKPIIYLKLILCEDCFDHRSLNVSLPRFSKHSLKMNNRLLELTHDYGKLHLKYKNI